MDLKQQRAAALKAANDIVAGAKAAGRELTADENATVAAKITEVKGLDEKIAAAARSESLLKDLSALGEDDVDTDDDPTDPAPRAIVTDRQEKADRRTFGERFVKSAAYEEFRKAHPSGVGNGSPVNIGKVKVGTLEEWHSRRKALTSPQAHIQPVRMPLVDQVDRDRLTFLDLIDRGQTGGNFEYVQVTAATNNAKVVPEATSGTDNAALKPVSELATQLADAKVYTYADGYDVTNQLLADAPAFATYMNSQLGYNLDSVIEDKLINGSGTSGEPKGLLHTTGVQQQTVAAGASVLDFIKGVRRGITKVTRLPGGTVQAIVLSPEDDEEIDLLQDDVGRFYGQGPFGSGPGTLWGRPRVTSERLEPGQSILGDFKQIALLDREGLSVLAFNQHKDYAQRNMTYVRGELRAAQVIWKPSRLVVVQKAAG
ncbi:phage major capsid protein, HK97 family [Cellulosimicrobium cellulans]|nr:phage major capsid protein, HK97 family [Cellulosimicrobium cellulans]